MKTLYLNRSIQKQKDEKDFGIQNTTRNNEI